MGHIEGLDEIPMRHVSEAEVIAARNTVLHFATDVGDATELLRMLGLLGEDKPDPQVRKMRCDDCGVVMGRRRNPHWRGSIYYGARGRCERCYSRFMREARNEAPS